MCNDLLIILVIFGGVLVAVPRIGLLPVVIKTVNCR